MTMQFLASVRRNQKQWMVVLTILSIFAFLFDDVVRGANNLTSGSTALFFAVLCAGGMSIIGYPRRHTVMFGAIGFVVGGGAALIGSSFAGPRPVVRTSVGNLTGEQIGRMQQQRQKIHRFLAIAGDKIGAAGQIPNFGDPTQVAMVSHSILRQEARRMGVSVSDEAVNAFLKNATQGKLTKKDYFAALKESEFSESELFDAIRHELEAQLVGRLMTPPATEDRMLSLFSNGQLGRVAQVSPEMAWENFRRLNVRQELSAVAIPVSEFVKQVPEPSDTELLKYFDERKKRYGDDRGNPGFLEQPKVKLGYLVASDLNLYEKGLTDATDQEVVDYYNAHREDYRIREVPDFPDSPPSLKSGAESITPEAPADATAPANTPVETPAPAAEKPANEAPAKDAKPAPDSKENGDEKKAEDKPKLKEKAVPENPCGEDEPKKEEKNPEAKPADSDAKPEVKPADAESKPADKGDVTPPAPALPSDNEGPKLTPPSAGFGPGNFSPLAPPKYRDLNDDLKLEIREKLLRDKAFAKMSAAADAAFQFMIDLSLKLPVNPKERATATKDLAEKCKKYAADKGLEYVETKAMTYLELRDSMDDRIGSATETVSASSARRNVRTVADIVFEPETTGRSYRVTTYSPQRADSPKMRYSYWPIEHIPAKEPDLKNEATRQLVVDAWKFEKARALAEVRAKELAEIVKKMPTDIPAALSGQTINGTKDSPAVTVRESSKFSWLRTSQSVPSMGLPRPEESEIDNVEHAGSEFMKLIFEQLGEGDVGVGLNRPKTVFYVVRVHDRDGSGPDGGVALQRLREQFMKERATAEAPKQGFSFPTAYDFLTAEIQNFLDGRWRQSFEKRFAITWEKVDSNGSDVESE